MTSPPSSQRAQLRLSHHPLGAALLAILWATLMVAGVRLIAGDEALASERGGEQAGVDAASPAEAP